jgi:hypothetical protein
MTDRRETAAYRDPNTDSWELQMLLIEDEQKRDRRRDLIGWIVCGVSVTIGVLFVLWVVSLT